MDIGIPKRAFFQVAFPCVFRADVPVIDGVLNDWGCDLFGAGFDRG